MKSKLLAIMMIAALLLAGCAGMQPGGEAAESTPNQNVQSVVEPSDTTDAQTKQPKQTNQGQQVQLSPTECNANAQTAASECEDQSDTTKQSTESTTKQSKQTQTDSQQSSTSPRPDSEQSTEQQTDQHTEQKTNDKQSAAPDNDGDDTPTDNNQQSDTPDDGQDNSDNADDGQQDDSQNDQPPQNGDNDQSDDDQSDDSQSDDGQQDDGNQSDDGNNDQPPQDDGNQSDDGNNESDSSDDVPQNGYAVRIMYDGKWQGSLGGDGDVRSVSGSGTDVIAIDSDPFVVSANAQKQDDSSDTLTVQILLNGDVVQESSTSAAQGLAQASYSEQTDDGGNESQSPYSVKISYDGEWMGTVGQQGEAKSVDGSSTMTFNIEGSPSIVIANAVKEDGGSGTLTVTILKNGEVVAQKSTSKEFGSVQVSTGP